jgi:RNA polymerase sigma-70 factor, ECF subfamily
MALSVGTPERSGSDLLARAKTGDLAAFEHIIRAQERNVFRLAWRMLGNVDDAADVAQEVFLRFYRGLQTVDEARDIGPWLYRVTVNAANDVLRRRRPSADFEAVVAVSTEPDPEQALAAGQRRQLARRALESLPAKERAAVVLRDIEGLSTAEVAAALGSSETTVRSQISSARVKLKRIVEAMLSRRKS